MLESYIRTGDGKDYVDVDCVREALGIKEDEDIFLAIKKLKEERERYKSNCDYFAGIAEDKLCDRNKLELELREALDTVDEYADIPGLVRKLREERDQLKDRVRRLRIQANSIYGASCGYSEYTGDKAPAFLCDVISYSWEFGSVTDRDLMGRPTVRVRNDSIRVELNLTPTANYKGTIDMEDLKRYIQNYGREKKLGVIESVDYQNAKVARAELAYLYKQVLGKEKLDTDLSPHEVMKAIHDEYKRVKDSRFAFSQSLQSVYMHVYEGTGYKTSDIYAAPDKIAGWIITRYDSTRRLGHMETICDINDFIDELCDQYNVVQPDRSKTTRERLDYIFSVLGDYRGMHDKEWYRVEELIKEKRTVEDSLAELRAKIREIYRSVVDDEWDEHLSYTSAMNDINEEYKRFVHNFEERTADWSKAQQELDRYKLAVGSLLDIPKGSRDDINAIERSFNLTNKKYVSLKEFRNNVCEILDIPSSIADDQERILKEIHDFADRYYELRDFRADICGALDICGMLGTPKQNDKYILEQVEKLKGDVCTSTVFRNDVAKAVCSNPNDSNADILKAVEAVMERATELQFNTVDKDNVVQPAHSKTTRYKSLQEFRDSVYKELGLPRYSCTLTEAIDELKKRLNHKDYTDLRKAIWEAMDRKPETLPEETARLVGEVRMLQLNYVGLKQMHDEVAEAIGITYPTTNQFIVSRVANIYKDRGEAHDLAMELDRKCIDLTAKNSELQQKFQFQSGLRQQWHARYESEHERANCVQKALDREREKSRVKDISLETAKKQYEKVCSNLETAECAINGMKSKVRELQKELKAERHPNLTEDNLTEDNETHPIDTDPGYLRRGEEESDGTADTGD